MTVCIAGMHRSHTSMVARMLQILGVFIGPEDQLMAPTSANAKGYWEDQRFVRINDEILKRMGGSWREPPGLAKGWETDSRLDDLRKEAEGLAKSISGHDLWGWKDPRNCLTAEFWASCIPDLVFVFCIRDPLDVAESLFDRLTISDFMRIDEGLSLWLTYNRSFLEGVKSSSRLVTHGASYLYDPIAELGRISEFLEVSPDASVLQAASGSIGAGLREGTASRLEPDRPLPQPVRSVYEDLCRLAGPVYAKALRDDVFQEGLAEARKNRCARRLQALESAIADHVEESRRLVTDLRDELDRITSTRWWKLRERLAPIVYGRRRVGPS